MYAEEMISCVDVERMVSVTVKVPGLAMILLEERRGQKEPSTRGHSLHNRGETCVQRGEDGRNGAIRVGMRE